MKPLLLFLTLSAADLGLTGLLLAYDRACELNPLGAVCWARAGWWGLVAWKFAAVGIACSAVAGIARLGAARLALRLLWFGSLATGVAVAWGLCCVIW